MEINWIELMLLFLWWSFNTFFQKEECIVRSNIWVFYIERMKLFVITSFFLKVGPNRSSFIYYDPFYRTYKYTNTQISSNKFTSSTGFITRDPWCCKHMTYQLCYDAHNSKFLCINFQFYKMWNTQYKRLLIYFTCETINFSSFPDRVVIYSRTPSSKAGQSGHNTQHRNGRAN